MEALVVLNLITMKEGLEEVVSLGVVVATLVVEA